jgi:hypothetical protein
VAARTGTVARARAAPSGLIVGEKRGRWMWWRLVPERLDALRRALR